MGDGVARGSYVSLSQKTVSGGGDGSLGIAGGFSWADDGPRCGIGVIRQA